MVCNRRRNHGHQPGSHRQQPRWAAWSPEAAPTTDFNWASDSSMDHRHQQGLQQQNRPQTSPGDSSRKMNHSSSQTSCRCSESGSSCSWAACLGAQASGCSTPPHAQHLLPGQYPNTTVVFVEQVVAAAAAAGQVPPRNLPEAQWPTEQRHARWPSCGWQ